MKTIAPLLLVALAFVSACSGADADASSPATRTAAPSARRADAWSDDPRVRRALEALQGVQLDEARTPIAQLYEQGGVEAELLAARLAFYDNDRVRALSLLEAAKGAHPDDSRVHATLVEIYATLGRLHAADDALEAGWKAVGRTAALERARGVLMLSQPAGHRAGLAALQSALSMEPGLPFVAFPLAQAYLLTGREALGQERIDEALDCARRSRELDPASTGALELEAEALASALRFDEALVRYSLLAERGVELGAAPALLHHKAATQALLVSDRAGALRHYLRARALGLSDAELGFGVTLLREEAHTLIDRGIASYDSGALEEAEAAFREALVNDPWNEEASNHLGVVLFRAERFAEAAGVWQELWDRSLEEHLQLPEPVHLNLAKAWKLAGEDERARRCLRDYLAQDPDGTWAKASREVLARLEEQDAEGPP